MLRMVPLPLRGRIFGALGRRFFLIRPSSSPAGEGDRVAVEGAAMRAGLDRQHTDRGPSTMLRMVPLPLRGRI